MIDLGAIFQNLQPYLVYLGFGFVVAFLLTPLIGRLGFRIGAVDLPAHLRGRTDRTADRHIHDRIVPKLTVLILAAPIFLAFLGGSQITQVSLGVFAGIAILIVGGILDDLYDLSGRQQLIFQVLAAVVVVASGITITKIQVLGQTFPLVSNIIFDVINIGPLNYDFLFPADIIAVLWIVAVINFMGWSDGVDGVHGALTIVATMALTLIMLRSDTIYAPVLALTVLFLGTNLGFYPYNYNPAKMFYSAGTNITGFMLAVIAMMSTSKLATGIIVLGLPLIDAFLVVLLRIKSNPEVLRNPLRILSISDKNHLHFRLLDVGYSKKMVLFIELTLMAILCTVAFYFSNVRDDSLLLVVGVVSIMIVFTLIAFGKRRSIRQQEQLERLRAEQPKVEVKYADSAELKEKFTY